jgi:CubicO group peptidase (beta-lactamase class C family)
MQMVNQKKSEYKITEKECSMFCIRCKQLYLYLSFINVFFLSLLVSSILVSKCYPQLQKASYTGLEEDKFMKTWMVLEPIPVFEIKQDAQNMEIQEKIFHSDSLSYSEILASVQRGIYTIGDKKYQWCPIIVEGDIIDLVEIFGEKEFVITYAWAEINVSKDKTVLLGLGSDDGVKVWLNGELIHENWIGRPVINDDDIFPATFKKGKNQLLIKIQNMQYGWGFSSRVMSPELLAENLIFASLDGNLERIKFLLAKGVDINSKTAQGVTALHCAEVRGQSEISEFLLKNGANPDIKMPAKTKIVDMIFNRNINENSPGAALAVIKDGSIIYKNGYGLADLEYDVPITPQTIFHVASVSKQFTAFAIALLAAQGKLSLDDDIRTYLPDVPDFGEKITIRHLAHHTSGLRDQWELLAMAGWRLDDVITKEHILEMIRHQKELNFVPGAEMLYCNTGYTLLAEIVEKVSGMSFREFTHTFIFEPLAMKHTHFHDDHEMIVKNRAYSYAPGTENEFKKSVLSYANVGATSLFTTVEDLAKWNQNLDDGRIGGKDVIKQMHQLGVLNNGNRLEYAFGLVINEYKGLKMVSHSGGDAGYRSFVCRFPEQQFSVVVLSNLSNFNPYDRALKVVDIYLSDKFVIQQEADSKTEPAGRTVAEVDPDIYDAYEGSYELSPGFILTIIREDNRLMAQATGQGKLEVFPESETKFFLKVVEAQIIFQRDETGNVSQLTLHQNGQDMVAKRIKEIPFDTSQLDQYVGNYYSEELGTFYTISIRDSTLVAHHRRHGDIALTPTIKDQVTGNKWWFRNVKFMRDENQIIVGFKLTGGGVRNLRFVRK